MIEEGRNFKNIKKKSYLLMEIIREQSIQSPRNLVQKRLCFRSHLLQKL